MKDQKTISSTVPEQWIQLSEVLAKRYGVSYEKIVLAKRERKTSGGKLGEILVKRRVIDETVLAQALADQQGLSFALIASDIDWDNTCFKVIPITYAKTRRACVVKIEEGRAIVALQDPMDHILLSELSIHLAKPIEPIVVTPSVLDQLINITYTSAAEASASEVISNPEENNESEGSIQELLDSVDESENVAFVNAFLTKALRSGASDIHFEPSGMQSTVRFRVDGALIEVARIPIERHSGITSRLKVMADLDIAVKRLPQDGRFSVRLGGSPVDVRLSTVPSSDFERVVLRLLRKEAELLCLEGLGMNKDQLKLFKPMLSRPNGIVLVTGPTGSGKTSTLYAGVSSMDVRQRNILTIEDPVEYDLEDISQIQVNNKTGLTFAAGLRSLLRQDPDVIMVGEIRDNETASIAVQASLTGHLVLSTLHTNDAASAVTRLLDMDIEKYLASSSLTGIVAQRLVRLACTKCLKPASEDEILSAIKNTPQLTGLYKQASYVAAVGCEECSFTGYRGRRGVFEIVPVDAELKSMIVDSVSEQKIRDYIRSQGHKSVIANALTLAEQGITTIEEVIRVSTD